MSFGDKRLFFLSTIRPQDLISKEEQSSDGKISSRSAYLARPSNISIFGLVDAAREVMCRVAIPKIINLKQMSIFVEFTIS